MFTENTAHTHTEAAEYLARVEALEAEGLTTSDAQAVIDAEDMKNRETIT